MEEENMIPLNVIREAVYKNIVTLYIENSDKSVDIRVIRFDSGSIGHMLGEIKNVL